MQHDIAQERETRRYIVGMISKLDPTKPVPSTRAESLRRVQGDKHSTLDRGKRDAVIAYMREHAGESLTGEAVADGMRDEDVRPRPGGTKARVLLQQLHEEGVVRADRVTKGGGMAY